MELFVAFAVIFILIAILAIDTLVLYRFIQKRLKRRKKKNDNNKLN